RVGFEPTIPVKVYLISSQAPSASRPPLRLALIQGLPIKSKGKKYHIQIKSTTFHFFSIPFCASQPVKAKWGVSMKAKKRACLVLGISLVTLLFAGSYVGAADSWRQNMKNLGRVLS